MSNRHRAKSIKAQEKMQLAYTETDGTNALMYVMNREGDKGFLILGADDNAPALIGYTDSGTYDADNLPDNFRNWMEGYSKSIAAAIKQNKPLRATNIQHSAIEPLVTTEWNQLTPYNLKCDDRGSNFGVYTGCVATAMAQVINYHKYPAQGIGEHEYQFPKDKKTYTGYSNFAEHTYAWDKMLDAYASYNNPAGTEDAVATLMHDCGIAVDMNYNTTSSGEGSGASHNLVAQALINYFGYDRSVRNVTRCYYSDEEWEQMMLAELEANRPIIYAGASTKNGGHEFVMDGYDGNGCYHFNWGWSGSCNGYFLLTGDNAINPYTGNSNYGSWGTDTGYAFKISQAATIGIQPDKGTKDAFVGMGLPGGYTVSPTEASWRGNTWIELNGYLWNTGVISQRIILGIKFVNINDAAEIYYDTNSTIVTKDLESYYPSYSVITINIASPGTYYVYPVFKNADDPNAEWQDIMLPYGYTDIPTFTWKGSQVDISMPTLATLTTNGKPAINNEVYATGTELHCSIKAHSEVDKEFWVKLYKATDVNKHIASIDGTFIKQSSSTTKEYSILLDKLLENKELGDYYLKIQTWNDSYIYPRYNSYIPLHLIEELPEPATLTISKYNYSTYYNSQYAYIMPSDCEGYIANWNNGLKLESAYQGGATVPAGEPLVIYSEQTGEKTLEFTRTNTETRKSTGDNILDGTDEATALKTDDSYYFYALAANDTKPVGFYWQKNGGAAFTNGAHKAYLKLPRNYFNDEIKSFSFADAISTSINSITTPNDEAIYDLMGRKVEKATKGIYIKNGRKFIVR